MSEELFVFKEDDTSERKPEPGWKILSVEDDAHYQSALLYTLRDALILGRPLEILTANSAREAGPIIAANPDLALILLDVVMEEDDAGLRLVHTIRDVIGNATVRIVLLTGQPGLAPRLDVMRDFDIDDYWNKAEVSAEHLISLVTGNIRSWQQLTQLNQARQGLQMLIDASLTLGKKRDLPGFSQLLLEQIGQLIADNTQQGIVCARHDSGDSVEDSTVIAASGEFKPLLNQQVGRIDPRDYLTAFKTAHRTRSHLINEHFAVLYFDSAEVDAREYLVLVETTRPLTEAQIHLLQVFSQNISSGFTNIALFNRLSQLAYSDTQLGMPNRHRLERELSNLGTHERRDTALLLFDIDDFIDIVVTFGNDFSHELLHAVAKRLTELPNQLLLAHIGRDGFALLVSHYDQPQWDRVATLFNAPFVLGTTQHSISATYAVVPLKQVPAELPAEDILPLAESLIETARRTATPCQFYRQEIASETSARYTLLSELRQALQNDELYIELQPKVDLSSARATGFEALARWQNDGRQVSPEVFVALAETSGLINQLDSVIFDKVLQAVQQLREAGIELPVAFNASSDDLKQPGYVDNLLQRLEASGIPPQLLELEMTESVAMRDYERIRPQLQRFLDAGIKIAIDDFGTGYSSLAHITNLPASTLKIDRLFVKDLGLTSDAEHVVEMIVRIGSRFDFSIVAEGVEDEIQRDLLLQKGCHLAQGYLYARPMPLNDVIQWMRSRTQT